MVGVLAGGYVGRMVIVWNLEGLCPTKLSWDCVRGFISRGLMSRGYVQGDFVQLLRCDNIIQNNFIIVQPN